MGFYIQDDMWEAVSELPRKTQDEVIGSLARLFFEGGQTPLKGVSRSLFVAFRDRVILSTKRSECGKQNGKQKAKQTAKQSAGATESKGASEGGAKSEPSIKEGEGDKETSPKGEVKKAGAFAPPSLAEVKEWAAAEGWPIDAERFVAFYASNGWKVGKNPMRDWRAAAEGWCRRDGLKRRGEAKRKAWATCSRATSPRSRRTARARTP